MIDETSTSSTDSRPPINAPLKETLSATVLALYSENGSIARAIMEWRHKVVALYVLTVGAVGSAVLWLQEHQSVHLMRPLFVAGSIIACFLAIMDNTNAAILKACYRVGSGIERSAVGEDGGIYSALFRRSRSKRTFTYSRILRVLYLGTSIVLMVMAFLV